VIHYQSEKEFTQTKVSIGILKIKLGIILKSKMSMLIKQIEFYKKLKKISKGYFFYRNNQKLPFYNKGVHDHKFTTKTSYQIRHEENVTNNNIIILENISTIIIQLKTESNWNEIHIPGKLLKFSYNYFFTYKNKKIIQFTKFEKGSHYIRYYSIMKGSVKVNWWKLLNKFKP
jgi:hypothetical protein